MTHTERSKFCVADIFSLGGTQKFHVLPAQIRNQLPDPLLPNVLWEKRARRQGNLSFFSFVLTLNLLEAANRKAHGDKRFKATVPSSRKLTLKEGGPHGVSADGVLEAVSWPRTM